MSGKDLDEKFQQYAAVQRDLTHATSGTDDHAKLLKKRDELWQAYVAAKGSRMPEPGHEVDPEEGRTDGFRPLRQGDRGTEVGHLQALLGIAEKRRTEYFGPLTKELLATFQRQYHHAPANGELDRATWALLLGQGLHREPRPKAATARQVASGPMQTVRIELNPAISYVLSLDPVPERTFANSFNLGLLSMLVYNYALQEEGEKPSQDLVALDYLRPTFEVEAHHYYKPLRDEDLPGARAKPFGVWRPILRMRAEGQGYTGSIEDTKLFAQEKSSDGAGVDVIDTQGRVWVCPDHVVIAMRGTQELPADAITDASAWKVKWPWGPGYVPYGFYRGFEGVRRDVAKAIQGSSSNVPVFVCGHSLGGALATLVALYVRAQFPERSVFLYTYAQPRTTDEALAYHAWVDPKLHCYRFENPIDPVPMVPSYRTAEDLVRLLGDLPDMLLPRLRQLATWSEFASGVAGNPIGQGLSMWGQHEIDALQETVDRYKKMMTQLHLAVCDGNVRVLPFAELAVMLAPPDLDSRHFGVHCKLTRRGGWPVVEQAADRTVETLGEIDTDDLNLLVRATLDETGNELEGQAKETLFEVLTGLPAPELADGKVQLRLNPLAHSMTSYLAYLMYEFISHWTDHGHFEWSEELPFSRDPLDYLGHEARAFALHYLQEHPFWGDVASAYDGIAVVTDIVELW